MSKKSFQNEDEAVIPAEGPENTEDLTNYDRAKFAFAGVTAFQDAVGTDDEDTVADFLCDLMHMLDRAPKRFGTWESNMRRVLNNYQAEISPQTGPLANTAEAGSCPECGDGENQFEYGTHRECNACGWDSRDLECTCGDRSWYGPEHDSACDYAGTLREGRVPDPDRCQHRDTGRGVCADCDAPLLKAVKP